MKNLAFAGALLLALPVPAIAQDQCYTVPVVVDQLEGQGYEYKLVRDAETMAKFMALAEAMVGDLPDNATAIIIAALPEGVAFGLEIDGCLANPVALPSITAIPVKLSSGRNPDGRIGA